MFTLGVARQAAVVFVLWKIIHTSPRVSVFDISPRQYAKSGVACNKMQQLCDSLEMRRCKTCVFTHVKCNNAVVKG